MAPVQPHNRCRRYCRCLFSIIWKLLSGISILFGLLILGFYLVVQPRAIRFSVNEAKLTQFNYTITTKTLHYNLVLNFTARNPNKKLNFYYDEVDGHVFYHGTKFASTDVITLLNSFRQYPKSTNLMSGVFSGQHVVVFDHDQVSDFEHDKKEGVFHIDVTLYIKMRYRLDDYTGDNKISKIKCGIDVPFGSNGTRLMNAFQPTTCDVNFEV